MKELVIFYGKTIPKGYLLDCHWDCGPCDGSMLNFSGYWHTIKIDDGR